jgi:hypothetical protein
VIVPVVLHALRSRWPFRAVLVVSVLFALLNVGPILTGLSNASEPVRGPEQVFDHWWGFLLSLGLLLLYLLAGVCVVSWAVRQRVQAEPYVAPVLKAKSGMSAVNRVDDPMQFS